MANINYTEDDTRKALRESGIGVWRLESPDEGHIRFYGDELMNQLIGISDDATPEDRYDFFMSRIHPEDRGIFMKYYMTLKEHTKAEVVYRYIHPELGTIYIRCSGQLDDRIGDLYSYRGFHQNVTNTVRIEQETKRHLTEQAELYRELSARLLEHSADSIAKINLEDGTFDWISAEGDMVQEHPEYDDLIRIIALKVPEEYREDYIKNLSISNIAQQLVDKDLYSYTSFVHRDEDGELRRITYWYYRMKKEVPTALSIFKDTTDEFEMEKQLADALMLAKEANHAKTLFLNNMSHDIRTPMNAIIGFTNLAKTHLDDKDRCLEYLNKITTSSEHLLDLINDVLDMSRIESGKIELRTEECSVVDLVDEIDDILGSDARDKGILLTVDKKDITDEYIECDKLRLRQILINCVSNSIKFTHTGGQVKLTVSQIKIPKNPCGLCEYQFAIEDTGIGMSKEFQKKIFEPFTREESHVGQIEGTGLGMSICKNMVDLMKGRIEVESEIGVGTRIVLTFRFKAIMKVDDVKNDIVLDTLTSLDGIKILLVEDNDINQEIAEEILHEAGATVSIVGDGTEAVETIRNSKKGDFDLILMDIQMPVMNGYEATRNIRKLDEEYKSEIPIIAMTANAFEEDRRLALEAGMNGHLTKPIDIGLILKQVAMIMNK